jgi:uncharacterized membrane-anchored protein YjiN (DUF445 family)
MDTSLRTDETDARRALRRQKAFATGLLLVMAALTLASYWLPPGIPAELLQAAAKAGFVGGIADWFAVTALFRHPLGLPIPHTAIIPAQKARLGRALGRFVANHVFTPAEVARTLTRLDLPGILSGFLTDPEANRPAARALAGMLPRLLASVEDGHARRLISRLLPRVLGNARAGVVVARALRGLVDGGRHQEVFGFILDKLRSGLAAKEEQLRRVVEERVREQGGRLVGWALGASISRRVLSAVSDELDKMGPDNSELRLAVDEWVKHEIVRIEEDPARAEEIGRAIRSVLSHDTVQAWMWDVWSRLRMALEADAANPHGRSITVLEGALADLGRTLATDEATRARVQRAAEAIITGIMPSARLQLAEFIGDVIAHWDSATITDRLELRVGRDLQYVRVNGTLVGFLVGGLVYGLLRATFGHVAF